MHFSSGDVIELPRKNRQTCVVVLGVHENLGHAAAAAKEYFKRLCKWDGIEDLSRVKLFGYDLIPIDEDVSQIALLETQGVQGPLLSSMNAFDLMGHDSKES